MHSLAEELILLLKDKNMMLVTAESCTGGLIGAALTDISGSSAAYEGGFVTYANEAKMRMLGVNAETLESFGAVSEQTATEMVRGALEHSTAQVGVSVTGIAGPNGGTDEKPVGLVYIGVMAKTHQPQIFKHNFDGDRTSIRQQTVEAALEHLIQHISELS
jgi:nicotinamide-nucleotide amidase